MIIFYLPAMFLMCFEYSMHSNDTFNGWYVEQPLILRIDDGAEHIRITNNYFDKTSQCLYDEVEIKSIWNNSK